MIRGLLEAVAGIALLLTVLWISWAASWQGSGLLPLLQLIGMTVGLVAVVHGYGLLTAKQTVEVNRSEPKPELCNTNTGETPVLLKKEENDHG